MLGLPKVSTPVDTRNKKPVKRISPSQMEERKKKGLAYNCDDKWVPRLGINVRMLPYFCWKG